MYCKYSWAVIFLIFALNIGLGLCSKKNAFKDQRTKLSVYYETLCPDSKRFIRKQLKPLMASPIGKLIALELVPYGKATTSGTRGHYNFECQHGSEECRGNKIQSCALRIYKPSDAYKFVFCTMSKSSPPDEGKSCSIELNLPYDKVKECSESPRGGNYLARNGRKTSGLRPKLYFIPWIVFNDSWDKHKMERALKDLKSVVCEEVGQEHCR